jgi:putative heme-binding domain-containing protein
VQFQALLSAIGVLELAPEDLATIGAGKPLDPWMETALRLSGGDSPHELLQYVLADAKGRFSAQLREALISDVGQYSPTDEVEKLVGTLFDLRGSDETTVARWRLLVSLQQGLARRKLSLDKLFEKAGSNRTMLYAEMLSEAAAAAAQQDRKANVRLAAIQLLAFHADRSETLQTLAVEDAEQQIRLAAVVALARHGTADQWQTVLARFPRETPAVRRAMLDQVLGDAKRAAVLLDEIEAGKIKAAELDPAQMNRLKQLGNAEFKARVGKLLAAATPADRAQALADYQKVLDLPNDPQRGQAIFQKNCATCHKIGEIGVNVAPDISDSRTKTPAQILADVIQPNRAIDANYLAYNVRLEDGETLTGILAAETATSITLRQPGDKTLTLSRSEIADLKSSGLSLMPDGLERQIPQQDMADLISFIKNWRYLDGKTPLGK